MSFSSEVKAEMLKNIPSARHCRLAEMAGYVINIGDVTDDSIVLSTDHESVAGHVESLIKKTYGFDIKICKEKQGIKVRYLITINKPEEIEEILKSVKYTKESKVDERLLNQICCKRAFLQSVFLSIGSVTDPDKGYHLELAGPGEEILLQVKEIIADFDIASKMTVRKNQYVLYIKEGQAIVDLLNVMGAHVALMSMENTIIMKEFRNTLNRKVNCEAANLIKTVNAGSRQTADIEYVRDHYGLENLPEQLREVAVLRLENPDASLSELSDLTNPHIGKSGINHRLRKISEIAESLR